MPRTAVFLRHAVQRRGLPDLRGAVLGPLATLSGAILFEGLVLTWLDDRKNYGEDSYISVGKV